MPTLEQIERLNAEAEKKQKGLYEKVSMIKVNETPRKAEIRKKMRLSWSEFPVLLEGKLHINYCLNDGGKLREAKMGAFEGSYIGGMDLGVSFIRYKLEKFVRGINFEQCPKCKLLYALPLSPNDLERIKRHKEKPYKIAGERH